MNYLHRITGTRLGNTSDFAALVELFSPRLDQYLRRWIRNPTDREEVLQDCFMIAWERIGQLQRPEAFPSWLWSIGRTRAWAWLRRQDREEDMAADPESWPDPAPPASPLEVTDDADDQVPDWSGLMALLGPRQRCVVELRHVAGLSYREIAAVCHTSESRVKSQLHEARQSLRRHLGRQWPHSLVPVPPVSSSGRSRHTILKEKIMTRIDTLRLGSAVLERLGLIQQAALARAALTASPMDTSLLAAIGQLREGPEFIKLYGKTLGTQELAGILNHVDKFTELRLIHELEQSAPDLAEQIKGQLFVFDDFVLCTPRALAQVAGRTPPDVLATALGGTTAGIREAFLAALDPTAAGQLRERLQAADTSPQTVRSAQEAVINTLHDLVDTGRIQVRRQPGDTGAVIDIN